MRRRSFPAAAVVLAALALSACDRAPVEPPHPGGAATSVSVGAEPATILATQVSAGGYESCAIQVDGTIRCWGTRPVWLGPPPAGTFKQISISKNSHGCGIRTDDTLACWGNNASGQTIAPSGTFTNVAVGGWHSCAVRSDGTVTCWGDNHWGQATPPAGTFTQVAGADWASCGLKTDGEVTCWGDVTLRGANPAPGPFTQFDIKDHHGCGIRPDGTAGCWGPDFTYGAVPMPTGTFTQVSVGVFHLCLLRTDGTVACWGDDRSGQSSPPAGIFTQISTSYFHACGITPARTIVCWGDDSMGQSSPPGPNSAPTASIGGPYTGSEGSAVSLVMGATDPDGDALTYTWNMGDGTTGSGASLPASHTYADDGTYTITLTADDGRGGTATSTTTAAIANVAPAITGFARAGGASGPIQLIAGSASAAFVLAFTDPAGSRDAYAAQVDCGNGTTLHSAGASPHAVSCTYMSAGIYTLHATVADEDGGVSATAAYRYVIAYDPDGGFATGSGFFTTRSATPRKAHFTLNAKFLPGESAAPDGSAKFWIPGGNITFESTAIEMLVVYGGRAQLWGTGRLNGVDGARFRITAADGEAAGGAGGADRVRVELWSAGGARIYDSQPGAAQDAPVTTPLDAGTIRIHR